MIRYPVLLLTLCILSLCCGRGVAAPPSVTSLYPAGGQRGCTVSVTAAGSFEKWPISVWTNHPGLSVECAKSKGELKVSIAEDLAPGRYWLRAYDSSGASALRPFLVGQLPEILEKESNDDPSQAQKLEQTQVVINGKLQRSGDVDGFQVELKKGETLVASLEANETLRSPMDSILQIVSPMGFIHAQNHDHHGLDPQIDFKAPADGPYIVRLFAFPSAPDSSIRFSGADTYVYRLTLTTGGFADFARPFSIHRESPMPVELVGWNIPAAARKLQPMLESKSPGLIYHAGVANPVPLRVESHPCHDFTTSISSAPLAVPFSATGRISQHDSPSRIAFAGKKGNPVQILVESQSLGLPLTPVVRVLDPDAKPLTKQEPKNINLDCDFTFSPPADGQYWIEVSDLHKRYGPRFVYNLRVLPAEPDFELTVASDRFALAPKQSLDLPVTVVPLHGFKGEVEVIAEGLPKGVTAEPAKGTKTVTLKLKSETPISGTFRIVGKSKGIPDRVAAAKLADFDTTLSDLWLTSAEDAKVAPPAPKKKK